MSDTAIHVNNVTKLYKLYDKPTDRLKETFGLSKNVLYKEHYALHNLDFEIKKGECVGIIGTNGAGKSTILKIITGVLNPTEGSVDIDGRISALLELGAGFNMEYTGIENIYLNGLMIGFSREEIDAKLEDIISFADIGEFINQPVKTYSSGMFVRLAFAVAINIDPEILIVDEALSVGDAFFQSKCFKKFEEFKEHNKTILFVSHDLGSISKYCDRAILLNKGRKVAEGRPSDIIDIYKKILVGQYREASSQKQQEDGADVTGDTERSQGQSAWKDSFLINSSYDEYGDKQVEMVDFAVTDKAGTLTDTLFKGDEFTIKVKIRAHEAVDDPIVAFTIKDIRGTDITGTNTMFEGKHIGHMEKDEERIISFTQRLSLQGGQYLISFGCTRFEENDFLVYHRLYDVICISVVSDKNTVGFFDAFSDVSIE